MTALLLALGLACTDYGYAELTVVDLFQQGGVDQVSDILYVVDDSASMGEELPRLAENFGAFTEVLEDTRIDFRLGVVTTDSTAGAALQVVLDDETPDLGDAFLAAIDVGDEGSRTEEGLAQALSAANPSVNPGFLRNGAELHVVVVSDEDDQSRQDPSFYTHELQVLKGGDRITVHALVGDMPAGCASGTSAASAGPRYLEAVELTGGLSASICAADYTDMLRRVGLDIADWNDTFQLSQLPEPDTIVVRVDDVLIPSREDDGWVYLPGDNAVRFTGRAIPRPGMEIQVSYDRDVGTRDTAGAPPGDTGA